MQFVSARTEGQKLFLAAGVLIAAFAAQALAQSSSRPKVVITPGVIQLPVIPQGNYLDPGPGPAIRPDVSIGRGENNDYVFPPNLNGFYGSGPPGDPTANNGSWSPLSGSTPSF